MNYTFNDMARLYREDRTVEDAVGVIRTTVKLHGPRLVQEEIASLAPRQPVDRGLYRRSFHYEDVKGGATIYSSSPYAAIIERGRRAGAKAPPLSVIMEWVRRKRIAKTPAEIRSAAFVIARAIKRRGLPGRFILALASRRLDLIVRDELKRKLLEKEG